jgi:hypothetical protein
VEELYKTHIYIEYGNDKGFLKLSIIPNFHNLDVNVKYHRIFCDDLVNLKNFKGTIEKDPDNAAIVNLIYNRVEFDRNYDYKNCEWIIDHITKSIENKDINDDIKFYMAKDLVLTSKIDKCLKIRDFFDSFLRNRMAMHVTYRLYLKMLTTESDKKSVTNIAIAKKEPKKEKQEVKEIVVNPVEENEITSILDLAAISTLRSALIHYSLNYFQYISEKYCRAEEENGKIKIIAPSIFPNRFNLDIEYIYNFILTVVNYVDIGQTTSSIKFSVL